MSFAAAAAVGVAGAASAGIQASSGEKAADAAAGGQLQGLEQANQTIRDAIAQYDPYRRGGDQAYRRLQRFYGFRPPGRDPDAPRALTAREKRRFARFQGRSDLTPAEQRELAQITRVRDQRRAYRQDFDLARTVGQDEERALLGLEESFGKEEEGIFGRQEQALADYTARNTGLDTAYNADVAGLDSRFASDVGALDTGYARDVGALDQGFRAQTGKLDDAYYAEERALRDKIAKGDVTLDPGYQFRLEQGKLARERGAAARGGLLSGGHLKDLEDYSQGLASQEFGAATGRLYDLYGLGKSNYTQRRGDIVGDYERGRGYTTGDYTLARGNRVGDYERGRGYRTGDYQLARGFGRQDYDDLQTFLGQNLAQRRSRFDRRYGQGMDQRNFAIDRFGRRVGGAQGLNQQGFNALGAQTGLAGTLAQLYGQAGQVRGQQAAAPYQALGQFGGGVADDLGFLALLYGTGGLGRGLGSRPPAYDPYADLVGVR